MKTIRLIFGSALVSLAATLAVPAQDAPSLPYDQKMDMVYGEVHGTGLLMDVFTPKGKANGLGIVDVVSGAWYSDRRKIRDHIPIARSSTASGRATRSS